MKSRLGIDVGERPLVRTRSDPPVGEHFPVEQIFHVIFRFVCNLFLRPTATHLTVDGTIAL